MENSNFCYCLSHWVSNWWRYFSFCMVTQMIEDEKLIDMIRASATEQLPIAVMTVKEMRQFATQVARDIIKIIEQRDMYRENILTAIREKYVNKD